MSNLSFYSSIKILTDCSYFWFLQIKRFVSKVEKIKWNISGIKPGWRCPLLTTFCLWKVSSCDRHFDPTDPPGNYHQECFALIRSQWTRKCSSNWNKPNSERQPLIAVQSDNIEHELKICRLFYSEVSYILHIAYNFSQIIHLLNTKRFIRCLRLLRFLDLLDYALKFQIVNLLNTKRFLKIS